MSRTVTGTLLLPNGQPMANARIFFTAKRTEAVSIIDGVNAFFDTNGSGVYNQVIVDGFYSVSIEWQADPSGVSSRRWNLGDAVIEGGANTTLEALLIATNPPDDVALTVFYEILEQTQQACDDAEAAAIAAAASAATISPSKQAQWDQAYEERNRWDGSSAGLNAPAGRASLLLGNAAQATLMSTALDSTPDRAMKVGSFNLGVTNPSRSADFASIPMLTHFNWPISTSDPGSPGGGLSTFAVIRVTVNSGVGIDVAARDSSGAAGFYWRGIESGTPTGWKKTWDTGNTSAVVQTLLSAANKDAMGIAIETSGSFDPIVVGSSTGGSCTYTNRIGRFRKIGTTVHFQMHVGWTGHTGSGRLTVGGLPYASNPGAGRWSAAEFHFSGIPFTSGSRPSCLMTANATSVSLYQCTSAGSLSDVPLPATGNTLIITGSYEV